jgi:hypothetical protein
LIPTVRFGVTRAIYSTPFSDTEKVYHLTMIHSLIEFGYCVKSWFIKLKVHFVFQGEHWKILNNFKNDKIGSPSLFPIGINYKPDKAKSKYWMLLNNQEWEKWVSKHTTIWN